MYDVNEIDFRGIRELIDECYDKGDAYSTDLLHFRDELNLREQYPISWQRLSKLLSRNGYRVEKRAIQGIRLRPYR